MPTLRFFAGYLPSVGEDVIQRCPGQKGGTVITGVIEKSLWQREISGE